MGGDPQPKSAPEDEKPEDDWKEQAYKRQQEMIANRKRKLQPNYKAGMAGLMSRIFEVFQFACTACTGAGGFRGLKHLKLPGDRAGEEGSAAKAGHVAGRPEEGYDRCGGHV